MKAARKALLMVGLLSSWPASAQTAPGRSGSSTDRVIIGGRDIWDDLNEFGECFAAQQTKDALRLVTPEAGSVEEARVYKALFSNDTACLGDLAGLTVPWQLVRGAIGEGFYKRAIPLPPNLAFSRDLSPDKVKSVMDAATCYAAHHPADAQALIERTKPDSKEQAAALDAHWDDFVACLPANMPAGFKFDTLLLRYRIAESLWRLGYAKGRTQ